MLKSIEWEELVEEHDYIFKTLVGKTAIGIFYITSNTVFDNEFYCIRCPVGCPADGKQNHHEESLEQAKKTAQEKFQEIILDCLDGEVQFMENIGSGKVLILK